MVDGETIATGTLRQVSKTSGQNLTVYGTVSESYHIDLV
jgi:hypothetical protein